MKGSWCALVAVLAAAPFLHAQRLSDQITVNVVEVPVSVTRFNGEPMEELTKNDFELLVNGKPHPIGYFDAIGEAEAASTEITPEIPRDLHRRRLFLLLFDPMNSTLFEMLRGRMGAEKFVDSAPAGDTFGVAVARHHRVEFLVPFTSDRVAVKRAIATLRPSLAGDAFGIATLERERIAWGGLATSDADRERPDAFSSTSEPAAGGSSVWFRSSRAFPVSQLMASDEARIDNVHSMVRREKWVKALGALADRLAPLNGVKHVVLLSGSGGGDPMSYEIPRMQAKFHKAGVFLDAVGIGGLKAPWGTERYNDGMGYLRQLSLDTGGMVTSDFGALRRMQKLVYVLGFVPPASARSWNTIDVRLRNKRFGTDVRHRRGYATDSGPGNSSDGLLLADVLLNDIPQNGLTVDLRVATKDDGAMLVAQVPGAEVLAHGDDGATTMDVFLYVFDARDVVAGWTQVRVRVDHERGQDFLAANPYTIRKNFLLAPGRYSAKALLRVVGKDVIGFEQAQFDLSLKGPH